MHQGVFRARALAVGSQLEVAGVVQKHCRDREFKMPYVQNGCDPGAIPALEQLHEAKSRLQSVLEVVIVHLERQIIEITAVKHVVDIAEKRIDDRRVGSRMGMEKGRTHNRGHSRCTLGIDLGEHYTAVGRRIIDIIANNRRSCELKFQSKLLQAESQRFPIT